MLGKRDPKISLQKLGLSGPLNWPDHYLQSQFG
jgi:hypothetical protein